MRKTTVKNGIRHAALAAASLMLAGTLALSAHASFTLSDDFGGVPQPLSNARVLENPRGFQYDNGGFGRVTPGEVSPFTQTILTIPAASVQLQSGNIQDIDVYVRMRHPNPKDLQIFLRHTRAGNDIAVVHLKAPFTGCSENDFPSSQNFNQHVFLYFDDEADSDINGACDRSIPSQSGRYFPTTAIEFPNSNFLSTLNGRRIDGVFELIVRDWGVSDRTDLNFGIGSENRVTDTRGAIVDWGVVINGLQQGDVAPRQLTPSTPNLQSGNGLLLEQDYVVSAFHLLGFNTLDDRIASGRFLSDGTDPGVDSIGLFDDLRNYLDIEDLDSTLDDFVALFRSSGTEFSRLDTAPANSFGDGIISVADFVQTARYVSGLDPVVDGTGPLSRFERIITAVVYDEDPEDPGKLILSPGLFRGDDQPTRVSVIMRSTSTETEVGFGLQYDPELLELVDVVRGPCLPENAIFQVDRNVDLDEEGLVGLRVGVLPDARFLCLPVPQPLLSGLAGQELTNIKVRNEFSQPLLLRNSITTSYEIEREGDALTALFRVHYENEVGQELNDFRFNLLIDRTKLKLKEDQDFDGLVIPTLSSSNTEIIFPGNTIEDYLSPIPFLRGRETPNVPADKLSHYGDYQLLEVSGPVDMNDPLLVELAFEVIAGRNDADNFTPNRPSIRLLRSNRSSSLDSLNNTPIFNLASPDPTVDRYYTTFIDDLNTGSDFGIDGPMVDWEDEEFDRSGGEGFVQYGPNPTQLRLSYNTQTITKFDFNLTIQNPPSEDLIDFVSPFGQFDIQFEALAANFYRVTGSLDAEAMGALNGIFITVTGTGGTTDTVITSIASANGDEFIFYTGAEGTIGVPVTVELTTGEKTLLADAPDAQSVDTDKSVVDLRPSQGSLRVTPRDIRRDGDDLFFDVTVDATTRGAFGGTAPTVGAYAFYLNYDATILRLVEESATAGGAGFSGLPTFTSAQPVEYNNQPISLLEVPNRWTTNIRSVLVQASDPESTFAGAGGTLLNLSFEVLRDSPTPPSVTLTAIPPVNNNIELAHFYFRALPGQGSVASELNFVNVFDGLYARNPAGTNLPGYFVDGALTVIDTSDTFPTVRIRDTVLRAGEEGTVQVVLDSQGLENAAGFTLVFDNEDLELLSVTKGRDLTSGAFFFTNPNENNVAPANQTGRLKLLTALSPGNTFPEGERILANLRFRSRASEDPYVTNFRFEKLGDRLEIVDPEALVLVSRFPEGTVNVVGTDCTYTLEPAVAQFGTAGGDGEFSLSTLSGCAWVASTSTPWIRITSGFSGSSDGTVRYNVEPHNGAAERTGTIEVAGEVFTVTQAGCNYTLQPASRGIAQEGGTGSFQVLTTSNCPWTAVSNNSWITIVGNPFGTGNGTVQYSIAENVGQNRVGTITVAGRTFTISQSVCSYTLVSGAEESFGANGGSGTIEISTGEFCAWTVEKDATWITSVNPSSGIGSATISFSVTANTGIARSAVVRIGNLEVRINQDSVEGCNFTITPTAMAFSNAGGEGRFQLSAPSGCSWEMQAVGTGNQPVSWLRVRTADRTGTGSREIRFTVDPNIQDVGATADREARIRVAGVGGPGIRVLQGGGLAAEPRFDFSFQDDSQGWEVETFPEFFIAPETSTNGNLTFTVTDNENTHGAWRSPAAVFERPSEPGDLLEAAFTLSTDRTDPVEVPSTRMRFSTRDFHQTSEFVLSSIRPARLMPVDGRNMDYRHLFKPVLDTSQLTLYFDVLNFAAMGSADATVALERMSLSRSTLLGEGRQELSRILSLESNRQGWDSRFADGFFPPTLFSVDSRGLKLTPDPAVNHDTDISYGFWIYEPAAGSGLPTVTIEDGRLYRVSFVVSARHATQLEVNPRRVPTFRLRLNETSLNAAVVQTVVSTGQNNTQLPTFDRKVTYDVFMLGREEIAGSTLIPSIDMLLTPDDNDMDISIILESILVTSYPMD